VRESCTHSVWGGRLQEIVGNRERRYKREAGRTDIRSLLNERIRYSTKSLLGQQIPRNKGQNWGRAVSELRLLVAGALHKVLTGVFGNGKGGKNGRSEETPGH